MPVENPKWENKDSGSENESKDRGMPTIRENREAKSGAVEKFKNVKIPEDESKIMEEARGGLNKLYEQNEGPVETLNEEINSSNTKELKRAVESLGPSKEPWWRKFKFW